MILICVVANADQEPGSLLSNLSASLTRVRWYVFCLCRFREQFTNFASLLGRHRHMYQLFVHTTRARCTHMNEYPHSQRSQLTFINDK